jgi:hypothetical protein
MDKKLDGVRQHGGRAPIRRHFSVLNRGLLLFCFIGCLLFLTCKNPLREDKKKQQIIILIDDRFVEGGKYVFYWDGKNDDKQYIEPGDYIIVLEVKDWQEQEIVTALKGGAANENNQARFEPSFWQYNELQPPFPNPFKVQSGVNIPILLSGPSRAKITIYKN